MRQNPLSATAACNDWRGARSLTGLRSYAVAVLRTGGPLFLADLSALVVSVVAAVAIGDSLGTCLEKSASLIPALGATLPAVLAFAGLYPGVATNSADELRRIGLAATLLFASYAITSAHMKGEATPWPDLVLAWLLTVLSISAGRRLVRSACSRFPWWGIGAAVVGHAPEARRIYAALRSNADQGLRPLALIDRSAGTWGPGVPPPGVHYVVIATSAGSVADQALMIGDLARHFVRVIVVVPEMDGIPGGVSIRVSPCGHLNGIEVRDCLLSYPSRMIKRLFDLIVATLASPVLLLLTIVVALLNRVTSPGPVFFAHERIGRNGRVFKVWKFRTMVTGAEAVLQRHLDRRPDLRDEWQRNQKLLDDPRVTRVGRWLRRTSLDEVPQIWNVLRGEMSLIGPRPIVRQEIARYGDCFALYTRVRPGLTGLWQVSGRSWTTYAERVALDSFYVRNWSVWLDLDVFLRTFRIVLLGNGAR